MFHIIKHFSKNIAKLPGVNWCYLNTYTTYNKESQMHNIHQVTNRTFSLFSGQIFIVLVLAL